MQKNKNYTGDSYFIESESVRKSAEFGRLEITKCNISKECISEYRGSTLPNYKQLGLSPDRIYRIYRPASVIEAAAESFNSVPITIEHPDELDTPINAQQRVGATGSDTRYEHPYLVTSMKLWDRDAIAGVESGERREISIMSTFELDMTGGEFEGQKYDGVIKNLVGNNVALTMKGRLGPDVAVGDSLTKESENMEQEKISEILKKRGVDDSDADELAKSILEALSEHEDSEIESADEDDISCDEDDTEESSADDEKEKKDDDKEKGMGDSKIKELILKAKNDAFNEAKNHFSKLIEAKELLEPVYGKFVGDSAEDLYKSALKSEGVNIKGVHPSAYRELAKLAIKSKSALKAVGDSEIKSNVSISFGDWTGDK